MPRGKSVIVWSVSVLVAVIYLFAGGTKLAGMQMHVEQFAKWGYPDWFRLVVGATEVIGGVLLLVPTVAFYAAVVLAVEMIGAMWTHLTHQEAPNAIVPLVLLVLLVFVALNRRASRAPVRA
jgi:putative oxidoreductase